jgi:hypothetical protein
MPANLNFKDRVKTVNAKKKKILWHKVKYNLNVCSATHGEMGRGGGGRRQNLSVALHNSVHLVFGWLLVSYLDISKIYILKVLQSGAGEG